MNLKEKSENNILSVIRDGNELVTYNVEDKKIKLTFFDNNEVSELIFFINDDGNIETSYSNDNGKLTRDADAWTKYVRNLKEEIEMVVYIVDDNEWGVCGSEQIS